MSNVRILFHNRRDARIWKELIELKKKAIITGLSLLILVTGCYVYNAFYGNPVSRALAEQKLSAYLQEAHAGETLNMKGSSYNFKFAEYLFRMSDERNDEYIFSVKGGLHPAVTNDGIKEARQEKTRTRLIKEASDEIKAELEKELKNVIDVQVSLSGSYDVNTDWKKLKQTEPIAVTVTLNSGRDGQRQVYDQAKAVKKILSGYHYENIEIDSMGLDGEDRPGYVKYNVHVSKDRAIVIEDVEKAL